MNTKRAYITINTKNLIYNIKNIKKHIKNKYICAVIKDNAYGHNAIQLAKIIDKYVTFFGVSTIEEALALKKITNNKILILSHIEKECLYNAIKNDICLTISTLNQAKYINQIAKKINKKAYIHLAINTGMNRIGFKPNDNSINEIIKISHLSHITLEGIFSHFSVADEFNTNMKFKNYTIKQKQIFDSFTRNLESQNIFFKFKHIANSAGTILSIFDDTNMVRPGIILYGIYPSQSINKNIKLKPILSLYSKIINFNTINKNEYISYGNTFKATKKMTIATISIGYGNGYPRNINKNQNVIIKNHLCKICGRVTMDQIMVDVSNIKCKIGDKVTLIGNSKNKSITIYDISNNSNTLHYELLCNLNHRVPIYYI